MRSSPFSTRSHGSFAQRITDFFSHDPFINRKPPHLYADTGINDTVEYLPRGFLSTAAIARRSLSYVPRRPSFLTPSCCSSNAFIPPFPFLLSSFALIVCYTAKAQMCIRNVGLSALLCPLTFYASFYFARFILTISCLPAPSNLYVHVRTLHGR